MAAKKRVDAALPPEAPCSTSHLGQFGLIHPTIPGNELLQNAEALAEVLAYVEKEADSCKFGDLSHFVGTARMAAMELVQALSEKPSKH